MMDLALFLYKNLGAEPEADMASRTSVAAAAAAESVRFCCTFFLSLRRAVAWASVKLGVPSHPIGCESLPTRSVGELL